MQKYNNQDVFKLKDFEYSFPHVFLHHWRTCHNNRTPYSHSKAEHKHLALLFGGSRLPIQMKDWVMRLLQALTRQAPFGRQGEQTGRLTGHLEPCSHS
jgi:hypothetical protein